MHEDSLTRRGALNPYRLTKTSFSVDTGACCSIHLTSPLEGIPFTIITDHQPLVHAFSRIEDAQSARQRHHLAAVSEYNCTICHIPEEENPVADALSRIEIDTVHIGLDCDVLAGAQQKDPKTQAYRTSITNLQWSDVPYNQEGNTILCDIITNSPCPFIPACLFRCVFDLIHGLSHPFGHSMAKPLKQFIWHSISSDAKHWARACIPCQSNKVTRHIESGVSDFHAAYHCFGHIHIYFVGPFLFQMIPDTFSLPSTGQRSGSR